MKILKINRIDSSHLNDESAEEKIRKRYENEMGKWVGELAFVLGRIQGMAYNLGYKNGDREYTEISSCYQKLKSAYDQILRMVGKYAG